MLKALDHCSLFSFMTPHIFYSFRMVDARNKFRQPDEDTPFGRHLKEVTRYLNIGVPSFTGTYNATLPEEECWMIRVQVPGRTFMPVTEPIEFSFDAPTRSLGKSMEAHITMGRIGEVYTRISSILSTRFVGAETSNGR